MDRNRSKPQDSYLIHLCYEQQNLDVPPNRLESGQSTPVPVDENAHPGIITDYNIGVARARSMFAHLLPILRHSDPHDTRDVEWEERKRLYKCSTSAIVAQIRPRKMIKKVDHLIEVAGTRNNKRWGPLAVLLKWVLKLQVPYYKKYRINIFRNNRFNRLLRGLLKNSNIDPNIQLEKSEKKGLFAIIKLLEVRRRYWRSRSYTRVRRF